MIYSLHLHTWWRECSKPVKSSFIMYLAEEICFISSESLFIMTLINCVSSKHYNALCTLQTFVVTWSLGSQHSQILSFTLDAFIYFEFFFFLLSFILFNFLLFHSILNKLFSMKTWDCLAYVKCHHLIAHDSVFPECDKIS